MNSNQCGGRHGGDFKDFRFDDAKHTAHCLHCGAHVRGAYTELSPLGQAAYQLSKTIGQRRAFQHSTASHYRGHSDWRWITLPTGRRVQVAVTGRWITKGEVTLTRRDRRVQRTQAWGGAGRRRPANVRSNEARHAGAGQRNTTRVA